MCLWHSLAHSHSLTSNGWRAMGCLQWYTAASTGPAPVLHSWFHIISGASTFSSRCAASTSISGPSARCSEQPLQQPWPAAPQKATLSLPPTVAESVCVFFMIKDGLVTMNTSAFSTLLLQRLVFRSILTYTEKSPDYEWWAFRPHSWFCINQSERRLQCGA